MQSIHERGSTTIGVQRQLIARHGMFAHRIGEQGLELAGILRVLDAPADDAAAAKDVEDDIEIEGGPFHWSHQLGNVPLR